MADAINSAVNTAWLGTTSTRRGEESNVRSLELCGRLEEGIVESREAICLYVNGESKQLLLGVVLCGGAEQTGQQKQA